jgi:DNA-binding response OmpR family regulator
VSSPSRSVLVVEDDTSVREMLVRALSTKYKVYEAKDGLQASELITQIPPPSLIVCDVMMPRVDGFSFVRVLKADEKLKGIPILFLSAKSDPADVMQGIGLGARHYMSKPFKIQELLERVDRLAK